MSNLVSIQNIYLIIGFLVPGFIAYWVRAQFTTGRSPSQREAALSYLVLSSIYYAIAFPVVTAVLPPSKANYLEWVGLLFVGPAVLGFILGLNAQKGWGRRFVRRCGLNPVHTMPTAWDWKFGSTEEQWVLVTLKNGTELAGYCGMGSFMSSDPGERDIYVQQVYEIAEDKTWCPRTSAVLIAAGEIRTIEFWPTEHSGEQVEQHPRRNNRSSRPSRSTTDQYKRLPTNPQRGRGIKAPRRSPADNRSGRASESTKPGRSR